MDSYDVIKNELNRALNLYKIYCAFKAFCVNNPKESYTLSLYDDGCGHIFYYDKYDQYDRWQEVNVADWSTIDEGVEVTSKLTNGTAS